MLKTAGRKRFLLGGDTYVYCTVAVAVAVLNAVYCTKYARSLMTVASKLLFLGKKDIDGT